MEIFARQICPRIKKVQPGSSIQQQHRSTETRLGVVTEFCISRGTHCRFSQESGQLVLAEKEHSRLDSLALKEKQKNGYFRCAHVMHFQSKLNRKL
jgi:hypothetical protein